jgi:hypothetical protein
LQTGGSTDAVVINSAGVVSLLKDTNFQGRVQFRNLDISGTIDISSVASNYTSDIHRIRLVSNVVANGVAIPGNTANQTANEIVGLGKASSGFLRLSAENNTKSSIDLISATSSAGLSNSIKFHTNGGDRMLINGSGNVEVMNNLTIGNSTSTDLGGTSNSKLAIYHPTKPLMYISKSTSGTGGLLIGVDQSLRCFVDNRETSGELALVTEQNIPIVFKTNAANVAGGWATNRMIINGSGNVGIGTSTPEKLLDVSGESRFRGKTTLQVSEWHMSSDGRQRLFYSPDGDTYFGTGNSYIWRNKDSNSNTTDIMTLLSTGRLGIGTSNPSAFLHIINTDARSRYTSGANSLTIGIHSTESYIWNETDHRMVFGTAAAARMTILGNGGVGIGTQSPDPGSLLDVNGGTQIRGRLTLQEGIWHYSSDGQFRTHYGTNGTSYYNSPTSHVWRQQDRDFMTLGLEGLTFQHQTGNPVFRLRAASNCGLNLETDTANELNFKTNGITRMTIRGDSPGYIGIGQANPRVPLEIGDLGNVGYMGPYTYALWVDQYFFVGYSQSFIAGIGHINPGNASWNLDISIFAPRYIVSDNGFGIWSDARIKRDIVDLEDKESLIKIRRLQPKKFTIVSSNLLRGKVENKYGFIAQEVEEVLEHSVIKTKEIIPNFMVHIKLNKYTGYIDQPVVDSSNNISYYLLEYTSLTPETYDINYKFNITGNHDISGNEYKTNTNEPASDQSGNQVFKLLFYSKTAEKYEVFTKKIINDKTLLIYSDKLLDEDIYILVGQEVDDFRVLDKDPIATITTAAIQEVDRQQQADKVRIASLEATVAAQQSLINDILERLKKLES